MVEGGVSSHSFLINQANGYIWEHRVLIDQHGVRLDGFGDRISALELDATGTASDISTLDQAIVQAQTSISNLGSVDTAL